MKSIYSITFLTLFFVTKAHSQDAFFWNQYAAGNPAATGVSSPLSVSSITSLTYYGLFQERVNAEVRVKKLHGALGAGYQNFYRKDLFSRNSVYANYSFHWKIGENSLLAFGVGARFDVARYFLTNTTYNASSVGMGTHYQYKNFKVGVALSTSNVWNRTKVVLSDMYVDYTFKMGENWALNTALHAGVYWQGGSTLMSRAIFKNKFWFGGSYDLRRNAGVMIGVNLNDKWSIGYSINGRYSKHQDFRIVTQSLSIKFQLPGK